MTRDIKKSAEIIRRWIAAERHATSIAEFWNPTMPPEPGSRHARLAEIEEFVENTVKLGWAAPLHAVATAIHLVHTPPSLDDEA